MGLVQNTLVIFLKRLFGTKEATIPLSSEPEVIAVNAYIDEPGTSRYNLRERKAVKYAEDSD